MASEVFSLLNQLEAAIAQVPKDEWDAQDPTIKRKSCDTLRKLSLDLEDWGDLVDRVIYSVCGLRPTFTMGLRTDVFL